MRISYTIYHALSELKRQILVLEKEKKAEKSKYRRLTLLSSMEWLFERGISLIASTNPDEKADLIDFFQDKSRIRKNIIDEKYKIEENLLNKTPKPALDKSNKIRHNTNNKAK